MLIVFLLYPSGYTLYIISRNIATVCLYTYTFIPRGRKEMFYLTMHSTHLQLYGIGHMVKDHSDSERRNPLLPHGYLFD